LDDWGGITPIVVSSSVLAPCSSSAAIISAIAVSSTCGLDSTAHLDLIVFDQGTDSERELERARAQCPERQADIGKHRLQDHEHQAFQEGFKFVWLNIDDLDRIDGERDRVFAGRGENMLDMPDREYLEPETGELAQRVPIRALRIFPIVVLGFARILRTRRFGINLQAAAVDT